MAAEPTGRMRLQAGEKIDRGQVRSRGEPFLNDGNVGVEHRWPTWHRFAPHVAAPMNTPLLTLFPTSPSSRAKPAKSLCTGATAIVSFPAR